MFTLKVDCLLLPPLIIITDFDLSLHERLSYLGLIRVSVPLRLHDPLKAQLLGQDQIQQARPQQETPPCQQSHGQEAEGHAKDQKGPKHKERGETDFSKAERDWSVIELVVDTYKDRGEKEKRKEVHAGKQEGPVSCIAAQNQVLQKDNHSIGTDTCCPKVLN